MISLREKIKNDNWQEVELGDIAKFLKGKGLSKKKITSNGSYKCILYGELYTKYKEIIKDVVSKTNTLEGVPSKKGDVLFPSSTTTIGDDLANATALEEDGILLGGDIIILRNEKNKFDSSFLAHYLTHHKKREIAKMTQGITIIHLYGSSLEKLKINLPSLEIQIKISEILSKVDDDIEKTGSIISVTKKFKNGLMQELFTRGIGHKKFKKTKLGIIPEEWDIVLLDSVAKRGSGHTPSKSKPNYWNGGIKWVSLSDSSKLDNRYIYFTDKEISEDGIKNSSAVLHPAETVILSRDAGVGKSAVLACEMAVSQHFMGWQCGDRLSNFFLYYLLQNWKSEFERIATGTTIKTIGLQYFKDLKVPLPNHKEQKQIADILTRIDDKIDVYKRIKSKLEILKKGLMQDLLSN